MTEEGFDEVLKAVRDEIGMHTRAYNRSYLRRRISSRMRRNDCDGYEEYARILREDDDEKRSLADSFWINVTGFFRNPDVWERLYDAVDGPVTAASVGCADGREAYSLGILGREMSVDTSVEGIDVDLKALETACRGFYDDVDTERVRRLSFINDVHDHLERRDGGYVVGDEVKKDVRFREQDVLEASGTGGFDVVLCRNLLIYVDEGYQGDVLRTLTGMLSDGGLLVLGKTESTPDGYTDALESVDRRLRIYRKVDGCRG